MNDKLTRVTIITPLAKAIFINKLTYEQAKNLLIEQLHYESQEKEKSKEMVDKRY